MHEMSQSIEDDIRITAADNLLELVDGDTVGMLVLFTGVGLDEVWGLGAEDNPGSIVKTAN
jgi:hypothetical protein